MTNSLGARLRYWRKRAGKTQAAMARELDVHIDSIAGWESERKSPTLTNLNAFVASCGVDMATFYGSLGEVAADQEPAASTPVIANPEWSPCSR
jgi:transcriptional regulator with XRE-family HTH domain